MIKSVSDSIADVKYGSQQIAKAYYGDALVLEIDEWVEYEFPNADAYIGGSGGTYGFTSSRSVEDTGATVYNGEGRMLNNNQNDSMKVLVKNETWTTANFILPAEWNNVQLKRFRTKGSAISGTVLPSWVNVYVSPIAESIDNSNQFVRAKNLGSSTNPAISDAYSVSTDNFDSDFDPTMKCKTLRIRFMRSGASSSRSTLRSGNFYFTFLIKKSELAAWKSNYNVST